MSFFGNCGCNCNNNWSSNGCGCNSCNNSNNSCCCRSSCGSPFFCSRLRTCVVRGPRGFTGPQGPQGIPGVSATVNNAFLSSPTVQSVAIGTDIPLQNNVVINGTAITHTAGASAVTLAAGTYLINWALDATFPAEGSTTVALTVGGIVNSNSQSTATGTTNDIVPLSSTAVITVATPTQITLRNVGTESNSFQNVALSIVKLA